MNKYVFYIQNAKAGIYTKLEKHIKRMENQVKESNLFYLWLTIKSNIYWVCFIIIFNQSIRYFVLGCAKDGDCDEGMTCQIQEDVASFFYHDISKMFAGKPKKTRACMLLTSENHLPLSFFTMSMLHATLNSTKNNDAKTQD